MSHQVTIFEMGPRDGLQNEKTQIATTDKITLVNLLSECGFSKIEVTSFVSPKWVPQMADAAAVLAGINRKSGVVYTALTPNSTGFENAMRADADEVAIFGSASEGFSQANINCTIAQSLERFEPVVRAAQSAGIPVRGYVSCVTDCPYNGPTAPDKVEEVSQALINMGCYEVSLGDTIGAATPQSTAKMLSAVLTVVPAEKLAGHFHDTQARALENIDVSLDMGVRVFDAAVGGLGGCPYAPGAAGNVATEVVVDLMARRGFETGIDLDRLARVGAFAQGLRT